MCRNIKPLYNFEPPVTEDELTLASQQFLRKVSGFAKVSKVNQDPFDNAVEKVNKILLTFFENLSTKAPKRNRKVELEKAKARNEKRFGKRN